MTDIDISPDLIAKRVASLRDMGGNGTADMLEALAAKTAELERERDERNERARRKWSEVVAKHEQDLRDFHVTVNEHQAEIAALTTKVAELEREKARVRYQAMVDAILNEAPETQNDAAPRRNSDRAAG